MPLRYEKIPMCMKNKVKKIDTVCACASCVHCLSRDDSRGQRFHPTITRVKTHNLLQVVNRREQCCAGPHKQCFAAHCEQCCVAPNVVTALFNHQYCYNLLTRLSSNYSNNEQACSINIVFSCFNNREQPLLLHQC